jgi:hypothetical protein
MPESHSERPDTHILERYATLQSDRNFNFASVGEPVTYRDQRPGVAF